MTCTNNLYNNSAQTIKTPITKCTDGTYVDVNDYTEAKYRIFASDNTTALVTATLTGGDIAVEADVDASGNAINVFRITLTKVMMDDATVPAGTYTHSLKVTTASVGELPPVFQSTVTVVRAND